MALSLKRENGDNRDDDELIRDYLSSGSNEILGILYGRYMELVYGVCLKYFRNTDRAQDAVMDIFEKLVTELPRHNISNFRSWLYVLTKNHCLMDIRASKKVAGRTVNIEDHEYLFMENGFEMHHVDKSDINNNEALENCIEQLKKDQRRCIRLFYYDNKCYREIAYLLKINEKKVKSHLQNAKRNLNICMEENYEEE
ncbi:MAG TPA: RNA polymerase subunit sigma-70 [Bacteroidales bacterium]|nr:RNA polymerase subunit sigma-70 [Bacteroidales bacterium]